MVGAPSHDIRLRGSFHLAASCGQLSSRPGNQPTGVWRSSTRCASVGSLHGRAGCGSASRRIGGVVDGAARDDLAAVDERASVRLKLHETVGVIPHVGPRSELARSLHELGGAVDPRVARTPRTDRGQVVDDERDLGVPGPHVAELRGPPRVQAADIQVRPVEAEVTAELSQLLSPLAPQDREQFRTAMAKITQSAGWTAGSGGGRRADEQHRRARFGGTAKRWR
jgi:hypothetical protein